MTRFNESKDGCQFQSQDLYVSRNECLRAFGYRKSLPQTYLIYFGYITSLGALRLFFHWYPHLHLYATHKRCSLNEATIIFVSNDYQGKRQSYFIKDVQILSVKNWRANSLFSVHATREIDLLTKLRDENLEMNLENGTKMEANEYRVFWCKKQCYVWDSTRNEFSKLDSLRKDTCCLDLNSKNEGLSEEQQILRRIVYGNNEIHIPVKSLGQLCAQEASNPFYAFQFFSTALWVCSMYYYFAATVLFVAIVNVLISALQTRKNQISLRDTMASTETVRVIRNNGMFESISSVQLAPGDIIELPRQRGTVICDAVLLDGTCIVNEAELTGESVPVVKSPLPSLDVLYNPQEHSYNTLFCGTTIIQSRNDQEKPVLAKVIKTGLQTHKGTLVTSILYPPPSDFKFQEDTKKILLVLFGIGLFETAFIGYELGRFEIYRQSPIFITVQSLIGITLAIPPTLPIVLMIGVSYARARLKKKKIYCTNTKAINTSGSVNCVCFDKTGTLTEDGLSIMGIIPSTHRMLSYLQTDPTKFTKYRIFEGMLVCHSLVRVDGELMGDVLDLGIFESTGWELAEPRQNEEKVLATVQSPDNKHKIYIVKQYQFLSDLQRMSVIVRLPDSNELKIYVKGSPEMILNLSKPESCPYDALKVLQKYTEQGYRVIAFGCSKLHVDCEQKIENLPREEVEKDLEFLGFIVFENKLKSVTRKVIRELRDCDIRCVMITGDNIQTAISVAKECGIISQQEHFMEITVLQNNNSTSKSLGFKIDNCVGISRDVNQYKLAISGDTWQHLYNNDTEMLSKICQKGAVFARMTSNQKQQLVVKLVQLGHNVAMCGDGANDCEALKAAHVGISLSEAESSVASPFVSKTPDISCVTTLIREGRAALVTSCGICKFAIGYTMTESITSLVLFWMASSPTDIQYMYIDFVLGLSFGCFFGHAEAYQGPLANEPPTSRLFCLESMLSLVSQIFVNAIFQVSVFFAVKHEAWYTPFVKNSLMDYSCYENYSIITLSYFQYIIMAILFSRGEPYRKPIYTNYMLMIALSISTFICIYVTVWPAQWTIDMFQFKMPPVMKWRYLLVGLAFLNFVIGFWIDEIFVRKLIERINRNDKEVKQTKPIVQHKEAEPKKNVRPTLSKGMSLDLNKPRDEISRVRRSFAGNRKATFENKAFVCDV